ncbi:MAG: hypothetical protein ACR2OE_10340 [Thermomicrobiales bacterium]
MLEPWKYEYPKLALERVSAERLHKQFVPFDSNLWKTINYKAFLIERQRPLAGGMNAFLDSLKD